MEIYINERVNWIAADFHKFDTHARVKVLFLRGLFFISKAIGAVYTGLDTYNMLFIEEEQETGLFITYTGLTGRGGITGKSCFIDILQTGCTLRE